MLEKVILYYLDSNFLKKIILIGFFEWNLADQKKKIENGRCRIYIYKIKKSIFFCDPQILVTKLIFQKFIFFRSLDGKTYRQNSQRVYFCSLRRRFEWTGYFKRSQNPEDFYSGFF